MEFRSDNFINIKPDADEQLLNDRIQGCESWHDPFDGIGETIQEPKYYRVDDVVFAEPIASLCQENSSKTCPLSASEKCNTEKATDEITFIDNVMVQRRAGKKYRKYHININNPANPTCPQSNCSASFSTVKLLKAHVRSVHCADRNKYVCDRCGIGFPQRYLLKVHQAMHEMKCVECPVCKKKLSARTNLALHLRSHSDTRVHQCEVCNKRFIKKATLTIHMKFVHRNGDLKCDVCEERFETRSLFSRHRSLHAVKC